MKQESAILRRYGRGVLGACCLLPAVGGCGAPRSPQATANGIDARRKVTHAGEELPGEIHGKDWYIPWRMRDPKHPNGPPLPVMTADARTGNLVNQGDTPTVHLGGVHVTLYRNAKPTAEIQAPHVSANQRDKIVVGTGGVTLRSILDPPDTVITADKMTWNTTTNRIVAEGNAHVTHRQTDGTVSTASGSRITCDTTLKNISLE